MKKRNHFKHLRLAAFIIFLLLAVKEKPAPAAFDFDNQLWMTVKLDAKLSKRLSLFFKDELRLGNDITEAAHFHAELGIKIKAHDLLFAGFFYRQAFSHNNIYWDIDANEKKAFDSEFQPGWFFLLKLNPGRVVFAETIRFEVPCYENGKRTKFRLKHVTLVGVKIPKNNHRAVLPYIKNIQILDFHPEYAYYTQRTAAGFKFPVKKFLDLDLYYMWQRQKRGDEYYDFFILGLGAHIKIG